MPELLKRDRVQGHLYSPNGLPITRRGMCNTTRVIDPATGILHDYIRAIGDDGLSRIMHAEIFEDGGLTNIVLHPEPVLVPGSNHNIHDSKGCEDPHAIVWVNPITRKLEVLMLYVGYDGVNKEGDDDYNKTSIILATSSDFNNFEKKGVIDTGGIPDKDCVPYWDGNLYTLRRPMKKGDKELPIVVSELDTENMRFRDIARYEPRAEWEKARMGGAYIFPYEGMAVIGYHGVQKKPKLQIYSMGFIVVDGKDLGRELFRTRVPALEPITWAEKSGFGITRRIQKEDDRKWVVMPSGYHIQGTNPVFTTLYGSADRWTDTASAPLHRLMEQIMDYKNRVN